MKRWPVRFLCCIFMLGLAACSSPQNSPESSALESGSQIPSDGSASAQESSPHAQSSISGESLADPGIRTIQAEIDGQNISITLNDTPLANALYESLPLELTFEDFNGTEKISYLPEGQRLDTEGVDGGHDPAVGDLCLYAPWGNLCIFYQDYHHSDDLYWIGHVDSGMDVISGKNSDFTVTFEKGNEREAAEVVTGAAMDNFHLRPEQYMEERLPKAGAIRSGMVS